MNDLRLRCPLGLEVATINVPAVHATFVLDALDVVHPEQVFPELVVQSSGSFIRSNRLDTGFDLPSFDIFDLIVVNDLDDFLPLLGLEVATADVPAVRAANVLDALDVVHPEHVLPELVVVAQYLAADHALQRPRAVDVVEVLDARALVGQELVAELAVHPPVGQRDEALAVQQLCNRGSRFNRKIRNRGLWLDTGLARLR